MYRHARVRGTVFVLIISLLMGSLSPAPSSLHAQANPSQGGGDTLRLPLVSAPPGPPDFTIISPAGGMTVSGTSFFAIEPIDPATISTVTFQAGSTPLGTDSTAGDGYQIFLDAAKLATGPLDLSATATGPSGLKTTKTVHINVVAHSPATAKIGAGGGTLETASGDTIVVPPGAVSSATTISLTTRTQQQVTHDDGIDWDALGVTFLGAIDVHASGAISKPLGVSVAGFGNRIQQGQAVVTYRILPDADGDGIGELVAVNGANLAPNGTIVSSPVPQLIVNEATIDSGSNSAGAPLAAQSGLHGPPGAMISVDGSGFNPVSLNGNVAVWTSLVNGAKFEISGLVKPDPTGPSLQRFLTAIPPLAPGGATLVLVNQSTASSTEPIHVTIDTPAPLDRPAADVFDLFFKDTIDYLKTVPTSSPDQAASLATLESNLTKSRADLHALVVAGLSSGDSEVLNQAALMIANSSIYRIGAAGLHNYPLDTQVGDTLAMLGAIATAMAGLAAAAALAGFTVSPLGLAFLAGFTTGVALMVAAYFACRLLSGGNCFDDPPAPPASCLPANTAEGPGTTGMGSAPPPGGNGCGNASGAPSVSLQSARVGETTAGRFIVKIFKQSGGSLLTPFTGATDPGGYFFIPLIPQGEPFRALATDQVTGASVSVNGVGPATGASTLINFDFTNAQQNRYAIAVGDTISDGVPGLGAGNIELAGGLDLYTFHANAGQRVFFDLLDARTNVGWELHSPSGAKLFDKCLGCGDPGAFTLPEAGDYTLNVGGDNSAITGTYSFKLWDVPAPQQFAIAVGDTITNGVPGPGAGNIETPGVLDLYTFHATAGQRVFFDLLKLGVNIGWDLRSPSGATIFDKCTGCGDPGAFTLAQAGTYTVTVGRANNDATGVYQFKLWNVPASQQFAIAVGDTISNGVPGPGAGNIETPGVLDIYTFNATAGQRVFFDLLGNGVNIGWELRSPGGASIFAKCTGCGDPGAFTLAQAGTYTITVGQANNDSTGIYSFKLWDVPAPQQFAIAIGDTISNGVPGPGAGNIETPGVLDIYTFNATAGDEIFVDVLHLDVNVGWDLREPGGATLFDKCLGCGDPGAFTLAQTGGYTITVGQANNDSTGAYQFKLTPP